MSTKSIQNREPLKFVSDFKTTIKIMQSEKTIVNGRVSSKPKVVNYDCASDGRDKVTFYDLLLENQIETGAINNAQVVQMQAAGIDQFADMAHSALSQLKQVENAQS